jgi:hypothetical protein
VATGKEIQRLEGFRSRSTSLAFSPDGSRLASWFHNGTVLIWDTSVTAWPKSVVPKELTAEELKSLWAELAMENGGRAFQAMKALEASPSQAIEFLARHLRAVPAQEAIHLHQLLKALDSKNFADREAASNALKSYASQYHVVLRQALANNPSAEARKRLNEILAARPRQIPAENLRTLRSIHILEGIGTAKARQVLTTLAAGEADARETRAAQASLDRVAKRSLSSH